MAARYTRNDVGDRLVAALAAGSTIIVAGASDEGSVTFAENQRADLLVVFNSGRFDREVLPSVAGLMPYGNANDTVLEIATTHVLPFVKSTPLIAGICGTDPTRQMRRLLENIMQTALSGVINYPTVVMFEKKVRLDLESAGLGFSREVEMISMAREVGLYTACYVSTPEESRKIAAAGVDMIVSNIPVTKGSRISEEVALLDVTEAIQEIIDAVRTENSDAIVLAYCGPSAEPEDMAHILKHTSSQGYFAARTTNSFLRIERQHP